MDPRIVDEELNTIPTCLKILRMGVLHNSRAGYAIPQFSLWDGKNLYICARLSSQATQDAAASRSVHTRLIAIGSAVVVEFLY